MDKSPQPCLPAIVFLVRSPRPCGGPALEWGKGTQDCSGSLVSALGCVGLLVAPDALSLVPLVIGPPLCHLALFLGSTLLPAHQVWKKGRNIVDISLASVGAVQGGS